MKNTYFKQRLRLVNILAYAISIGLSEAKSTSKIPLLDNMKTPLFAEMDLSGVNERLEEFINTNVKNEVDERCSDQINIAVEKKKDDLRKDLLNTFVDQMLKLEKDRKSKFNILEDALNQKVRTDISNENSELKQEIAKLKTSVMELNAQNEPVALTARPSTDKQYSKGNIILFDDIKTQTGITNVSSFKSTGKFVCTRPGLYQVSVTLVTNQSQYAIFKNGNIFVKTFVSNRSGTESGSFIVTLDLALNDTVWVTPVSYSFYVYGAWSCITIVKIK